MVVSMRTKAKVRCIGWGHARLPSLEKRQHACTHVVCTLCAHRIRSQGMLRYPNGPDTTNAIHVNRNQGVFVRTRERRNQLINESNHHITARRGKSVVARLLKRIAHMSFSQRLQWYNDMANVASSCSSVRQREATRGAQFR